MSVHDPTTETCGDCGGPLHTGTYTYCSNCDTQETWDAETFESSNPERLPRKRKGHKRPNNPKKTDYDNQTLGHDFFKKKQQGKEDMRRLGAETFEAMAWNDPKWADDRGNVERAFAREYPTKTLDKSSVHYLVYQSGASNKFHVFFLAQDSRDNWFAYNAYARIGYNPRLFEIGGPFSSKSQAESLISSKMGKKQQKGYRQAAESFGSESSDTCSECDSDLEDGMYSTYQCPDCDEKGCEHCRDDFCGDCDRCDDCCECKCSICRGEDWAMTTTEEGNVCRSCSQYCYNCGTDNHPEGMAQDRLCNSCAEHLSRCEACDNYITDRYDEVSCEECGETYCQSCEDDYMTRNKDDETICISCAGSKCTVCGDTAVHFYKNGEVVMCDKHFQQRYGKYSAEELSVKEPFQTGFKVTLGVIAAGVVGTLGLGALGLILTGLGKGDE